MLFRSDPRLPGGAVSPGALAYDTPVAIPAQTVVKGRIRRGIDWGPLAEALFYPDQDFSRLIATEIMYNPPGNGDVSGDEYEFLELQNRGTLPLDLWGYSFTAGIQATFSTNWKPASDWSNFTHSTSDRTSTIRLVHSAVQRALAATVCSSPRTDRMTAQPTSGSQVTRDRIGKPAAFIGITGSA